MESVIEGMAEYCYLPHRQLRKQRYIDYDDFLGYLPHRQLRKKGNGLWLRNVGYLPHRQLRKRRIRIKDVG